MRKRSWSQSVKRGRKDTPGAKQSGNKTSAEDGPAGPEKGEQRPGLEGGSRGERNPPQGFYPRGGADVTTFAFQTDRRGQNKGATDWQGRLPWWLRRKRTRLQCRRPGFHLWVGRSPGGGHGKPLQCSCLEKPMDRGAWWATVHGVTESDTFEQHTHTRGVEAGCSNATQDCLRSKENSGQAPSRVSAQ